MKYARRLGAAALLAAVFFGLTSAFAIADTQDTVVGFQPLVDYFGPTFAALLAAAAAWMFRRILQLVGLQIDAKHRAVLEDGLIYAVRYGAQRATEKAKQNATIDLKSEVVAQATRYALDRTPDALNRFGIGENALTKMIEARIQIDIDGDGVIGEGVGS